MKTSETFKEIAPALVKAIGEIPNPPKNAVNPHFKNRYADLASIIETVKPILLKNGLTVIQGSEADGNIVTVRTRIVHVSGEWIETSLTMAAAGSDPQKIGSAITYARRYSISSFLNIAADDDDDGEENRKKENQKPVAATTQAQVKNQNQQKPAPAKNQNPLDKELLGILDMIEPDRQKQRQIMDYVKAKFGETAPDFRNSNDAQKRKYIEAVANLDPMEVADILTPAGIQFLQY